MSKKMNNKKNVNTNRWFINEKGDLYCKDSELIIHNKFLDGLDWLKFMKNNASSWCNLKDFADAYARALRKRWFINKKGDLYCKDSELIISSKFLVRLDWLKFMNNNARSWCDLKDFADAYVRALRKAGFSYLDVIERTSKAWKKVNV